jgi:large subunit ribosomal protein L4
MKLSVKNLSGESQGELEVKMPLVDNGRGTQAVHDTVVAYNAAQRMGTASTKTMGEVQGSGKKPWRQKGTGMARAGSFASPLWRGGGVVFGPKPRDFRKKISKATRRLAFRKALGERLKAGDVIVVEQLQLGAPKTRELAGILATLQVGGSALVVTGARDENLERAARNLARVELTSSQALNTYQVLCYDKLVFTREAFEQVEQRVAQQEPS